MTTGLAWSVITGQSGDVQFSFISDRPVLDFVATVVERGTSDLEMLQTPSDLAAWVRESGIARGDIALNADDLRRARSLREALYALLQALIDGRPAPTAERKTVNAAAARPGPRLRLNAQGQVARTGDLDAVFALLAADAIDLYDSPDRALLRWCADARCARPFVDRSRAHGRRWCGMQGCGDRAKAAAYRDRRRTARTRVG